MLTRCPSCATTFRLRPEQLELAGGRVRCGNCRVAFSAIEHRIDDDSGEPAFASPHEHTDPFPPLPASASRFSSLGQRKRFVAQAEAATGELPQTADLAGPGPSAPETPRPAPGAPDEAPVGAVAEAGPEAENGSEAAPEAGVQADSEAQPAPSSETLAESPAEPPGHEQAPSDTGPGPPSPDLVLAAAAGVVALEAAGGGPAPQALAPDIDAAPTPTESADEERTDQAATPATADYLAGAAPARRWPWVAGMLLLGFALLVQLVFVFRAELAKTHPSWRPALEAACGSACTVELPREAELVSIESSELNPEDGKKRLQLAATLKNRAGYPQSYPHLELTLTDARDRALVRRVFAPADYLAKDAPAAFAPNAELAVKLMLELDEVSASGYRVYVFYP